jgi:hypothetical protein
MAEASQYAFELREVATALIKQQGLHEGRWTLAFEFRLAAGVFGQEPETAKPSAVIQVVRMHLAHAPVGEKFDFIVDAEEVNPRPGVPKARRKVIETIAKKSPRRPG